ncbi:uncharacterized protein LOC128884433 [Hylaeus volcanicus]|uniref:uncharacterized protein LOC128884433 n=1 Tax=Hylaeus volcanicus TaxID=313075 RepID=UPI0023B79F2E|nr:uncharacterized protein LOC128884433 [Hylaeus volcanicus]
MLQQLLNLPDFVSFLQFFMGNVEMVTLLFQNENGALLPSSLASQLCPMWFSILQGRELFQVLPSPLCAHCSTNSHHPFPTNSTRSVPFDCSLVNSNISPSDTSQKIFSNLLSLLFGSTDSTRFHQSTNVCNDTLVTSMKTFQSGHNCLMGYRGMVVSLSFFFFGNHLWHKVIEKYLNTTVSPSLSIQQVKDYMLDTFGLIELMSVLLVEFDILRQKENILVQFTRLYQIARNSPLFLMHLDLIKSSSQGTQTTLTKFIPFKVFLSPTLTLLHLVLSTREDLNGRGRDFLFCPSSTEASLTYVGALLDFVIQQFTGNWHKSESLLKQDRLTFSNTLEDNATQPFLHVEPALAHGSSFCISSLSQEIPNVVNLGSLQQSALESSVLTCGLPNCFQLRLLQNDSNHATIHSLLLEVLLKLCLNCSTTIQLHMSATMTSPSQYGFQNFTDFCRAMSLCHLLLRYWFFYLAHYSVDSLDLDQMITPLVTIFDTHLTDLSTATTTLLKSLVIYKDDLNTLAQLLSYHSHSLCKRQNTFHTFFDTARPAYFLLNVTAPILLLSLCCTILNLIKNFNVLFLKKQTKTKDSQDHHGSLIERFLYTLDEKKCSDMHLTYRLMILLENISKLPGNFSKAIDAAHLQSRQPTGLMDDMMTMNQAYRLIWVPYENYTQRFTIQISLIGLAFLNLVLRCPIKLDPIEMSSIASHLYRLPGIQQFTRRLHKSNSYKSVSNQRYSVHKTLQTDDYWRPVYERFFSDTQKEKDQVFYEPSIKQQDTTQPCRPLRSNAHIMWCRCLSQISLFNGTSIVHCLLQFKERFHFVATTVTQSTQLGVLEEFFLLTKLLAKMPSLEQIEPPTDRESILSLVFITLKAVSQLTQLCLARGQVEMSELFKPFSPREVAAANISDAYLYNMEKMTNETLDYSTAVLSGQPASVPSIYHQRVLVLILKIIQNVLTCLRVLQLETMTHLDFNLSKLHLSNTRNSMGSSAFSLSENCTSVFGDIFETLFHDVLDIGRIILQSLEDLWKTQKCVFNAICTRNNSSVVLPISLDLRCEKSTDHSLLLAWQRHRKTFETPNEPNALKPSMATSYEPLAFPASSSHSRLDIVPKTRDASRTTTHLTGKTDSTRPRISASKMALNPLHPGTTVPHIRQFSNNGARSCCPFNVFQSLLVVDDMTLQADTILTDCLPMCVTFASLENLMETIVALSVFFAFTCFQKLTCLTNTSTSTLQGTTVLCEIASTKRVNPSNNYHSVFEWPSVVRRLTEFFSTLQNTGIERFDSLNNVIKKMMKVISLRLGDDPKTLQKEF